MLISYWSSDVCSSDLGRGEGCLIPPLPQAGGEIIVCYRFTPHSTVPLPTLRTVQVGWPSTTVLPTPRAVTAAFLVALTRWSPAPSLSLFNSPPPSLPASTAPAPANSLLACLASPPSVLVPLPIIATSSRSARSDERPVGNACVRPGHAGGSP